MMFARAFAREVRQVSTPWGAWQGDEYTPGAVTVDTSMQLLAVYGCVKLITDSISTLPLDVFTSSGESHQEIAKPVWLTQPTVDLDFGPWCTQVLTSLLLAGNAWIAVMRGDRTQIVELLPLDPAKVTGRRDQGRLVWLVNGIPFQGEILHIPAMMLPGSDVGLSPIEHARQTISLGIGALEYGGRYFDRDAWDPGVVEIPGEAQPDTMKQIARGVSRKLSRKGDGTPIVLDRGAQWKPAKVTNEQAQFLETRAFTDAQIAGEMFLVDPSELGIAVQGTSLTYQNLESRNIRLVQRTLLPWIVRLEHALSSLMFQPRYVKFNVSGLLRADMSARWAAYKTAADINTASVAIGMPPVQTTEEMRMFEDWNPLDWTPPPPPPPGDANAAA